MTPSDRYFGPVTREHLSIIRDASLRELERFLKIRNGHYSHISSQFIGSFVTAHRHAGPRLHRGGCRSQRGGPAMSFGMSEG